MQNYEFDLKFEELKERKFNKLKTRFIKYSSRCDYLVQNVREGSTIKQIKKQLKFSEKFDCVVKAIQHCQKERHREYIEIIDFPNSSHYDDFKMDIISAFEKEYNTPNGISLVVANDLEKIIKNYKETIDRNTKRNHKPRFDYHFYNNLTDITLIKFFSKYKAYEEYEEYLNTILDNTHRRKNFLTDKVSFKLFMDNSSKASITGLSENESKENKNDKDKNNHIKLKYKNNYNVIETLYFELQEYLCIDVDVHDFYSHFIKEVKSFKIKWNRDYVELIYLIHRLQTNEESPHNIIKNHFLKEDGEEFEANTLHAAFSRMKKRIKEQENINKDLQKEEEEYLYENIKEIIDKIEENDKSKP